MRQEAKKDCSRFWIAVTAICCKFPRTGVRQRWYKGANKDPCPLSFSPPPASSLHTINFHPTTLHTIAPDIHVDACLQR